MKAADFQRFRKLYEQLAAEAVAEFKKRHPGRWPGLRATNAYNGGMECGERHYIEIRGEGYVTTEQLKELWHEFGWPGFWLEIDGCDKNQDEWHIEIKRIAYDPDAKHFWRN